MPFELGSPEAQPWYRKVEALMRAFDDITDAINALPTFNEQCDAIKALNRHLYMNSKLLSLIEETVEWKDAIAELIAKLQAKELQQRNDASAVTHTVTKMRTKTREESVRFSRYLDWAC
jgi:hypothetical protein